MASPAIMPCSSSDPNFTEIHQSQQYISPSNCSSVSAKSPKIISAWQVGKFITRKNSPSKNSDSSHLTKENLEEFNRRNELDEKKNSTSSPYYQGLTDSSLVINKKGQFPQAPGSESHAPTSVSWGSKSTFIVRVQEWTSCFTFGSKVSNGARESSSSSSSGPLKPKEQTTAAAAAKESAGERESTTVLAIQKPLRERVSEPSPPRLASLPQLPPSPPPISPTTAPLPLLMLSEEVILKVKDTKELVKERVFVWADKYRPVALNDFICNRKTAIELQTQIVANADNGGGHYLFEGLTGVGKRTMIWALLREAYGAERIQARDEQKEFDLKAEGVGTIQVQVKVSSQHVEVNLSDLKGYEKHVIVELIKESNNRLATKALQCNRDNCRAIILYEADKLSTDALLYIRWLLERYRGNNMVFFCCSDVSKLQPIKSLCKVVQLLPPSTEEIIEVLEFIARQEGIVLPCKMAEKIAEKSKNNLRQAIRSFEATWQTNSSLKEDQEIMTGWEDDIANIAINIVEEQSPRQLYVIRGKLQNLIDHNVSSEFIFKTLVEELKKHMDEQLQIETQIDNLYEEYNRDEDSEKSFPYPRNRHEETDKKHNDPRKKSIQHFMKIEEFIAKFMSRYKIAVMKQRGMT